MKMLAKFVLTFTALLSATSLVSGLYTEYEEIFGTEETNRNQIGRLIATTTRNEVVKETTDEASESFGDMVSKTVTESRKIMQ